MADSFILFLSIIEKSLNGNEGRAALNKPRTKTKTKQNEEFSTVY